MNLQKMMQQAQAMQTKMTQMQQRLEASEYEGVAGSGAVSITLSGKHELRALKIDKSIVNPEEVDLLEDLIMAAYREAKTKIDAASSEEMGKVSSGLNLPPGFKLPF